MATLNLFLAVLLFLAIEATLLYHLNEEDL